MRAAAINSSGARSCRARVALMLRGKRDRQRERRAVTPLSASPCLRPPIRSTSDVHVPRSNCRDDTSTVPRCLPRGFPKEKCGRSLGGLSLPQHWRALRLHTVLIQPERRCHANGAFHRFGRAPASADAGSRHPAAPTTARAAPASWRRRYSPPTIDQSHAAAINALVRRSPTRRRTAASPDRVPVTERVDHEGGGGGVTPGAARPAGEAGAATRAPECSAHQAIDDEACANTRDQRAPTRPPGGPRDRRMPGGIGDTHHRGWPSRRAADRYRVIPALRSGAAGSPRSTDNAPPRISRIAAGRA